MADRAENILPEVLAAWDFGGQVVGHSGRHVNYNTD